jgi:hypothetical protein
LLLRRQYGHVYLYACIVEDVIEGVELFFWTILEQPLVADRISVLGGCSL